MESIPNIIILTSSIKWGLKFFLGFFEVIFLPHFSTRSFATETSGRGVGMDEVKHQVTLLDGKIHVNSVLKKGTIITVLVPLVS